MPLVAQGVPGMTHEGGLVGEQRVATGFGRMGGVGATWGDDDDAAEQGALAAQARVAGKGHGVEQELELGGEDHQRQARADGQQRQRHRGGAEPGGEHHRHCHLPADEEGRQERGEHGPQRIAGKHLAQVEGVEGGHPEAQHLEVEGDHEQQQGARQGGQWKQQ